MDNAASVFGEAIDLPVKTSGSYGVPLTASCRIIQEVLHHPCSHMTIKKRWPRNSIVNLSITEVTNY